MKVLTASSGRLLIVDERSDSSPSHRPVTELAGGVHELLFERTVACEPSFAAIALISRVMQARVDDPRHSAGAVVWCQPDHLFYPPGAMSALGEASRRLYVVVPPRAVDMTWVAAECMRCQGVRAVIASVPSRLTRVEARRLQLAAERGRSLGVLLRPTGPGDDVYTAATRWLVSPASGDPTVQRWRVELIHGHGRHAFRSFTLERRHGAAGPIIVPADEPLVAPVPVVMRAPDALADRASPPPRAAAVG